MRQEGRCTLGRRSKKSSSVIGNGSWDAAQQLFTTVSNAAITLLLVTVVSTSDYGMYSYAVALSSLGMSVMTAGLSGLAVKKLVEDRNDNAAIITSLLLARELFAFAGYILVVIVSLTSRDFPTILATAAAASALFGRGLEGPEMWFLSHLRSRRVAVVRVATTAIFLVIRLFILFYNPSIWVFLILFALEPLFSGVGIVLRYLREQDSPGLVLRDFQRARTLVRESLPLMLSGLANQVNLKGDVVVLQSLQGNVAVAVYSLAARISELSHFLPVVFMNSLLPNILEMRRTHGGKSAVFEESMSRAYTRAFWFGVMIAASVSIMGAVLIPVAFGSSYASSVQILIIHSCATPFIFMAAVYSKWIIAEGTLWVSLIRHGSGAILNLVLCLLLIPFYGGSGAALSTVASYATASYLSCFIGKETKRQGLLMTKAILAPVLWLVRKLGIFR